MPLEKAPPVSLTATAKVKAWGLFLFKKIRQYY